jgi:hypothetical protein
MPTVTIAHATLPITHAHAVFTAVENHRNPSALMQEANRQTCSPVE